MLRKVRITLALIFWVLITWLLVDFTGTAHAYLGWMARMQFLPALLSLNIGALLVIVVLTLLLGRIYCSIICPLGVMQDAIAWMHKKRNRYRYSKEKVVLRYVLLILTGVLITVGLGSIAGLIAPYSTYGRIVGSVLAPLWKLGNNMLADMAERSDSYAFYTVDVWMKSIATLAISLVTWIIIAVMAWRNGRTWCNTICPVGTLLGLLSKNARLKVVINADECMNCHKCERNCKASCIDIDNHQVDYSRCVVCGNCLEECGFGAISFGHKPTIDKENQVYADYKKKKKEEKKDEKVDEGRRSVLTGAGLLLATAAVKAQEEKTTDGGFAEIIDKKKPKRQRRITPPGSISTRNMGEHCTACQLCVSACPNDVLRPSSSLQTFMQPEVSYERGYCRPECTRCSDICPTGAIRPITVEQRTATQVGHAVWVKENCIAYAVEKPCGNCALKCPAGAIQLVPVNGKYKHRDGRWYNAEGNQMDGRLVPMIPVVNEEKCIGCGACENLCPSRPFSAIYVEGHRVHREI